MNQAINAILIHDRDNVITLKEVLQAGSIANYMQAGQVKQVEVCETVP